MLRILSTIRRTETPDGAVLLDVERGQMFSLNPVGAKILDLVASGFAEAEIADQLSATCHANLEMVRVDVRHFLERLREQHIVEARRVAAVEPERR